MTLSILNDLHLGAVRSGGTTPGTAYQLRLDLLSGFQTLLDTIDGDLMILGDLFDGPDISKSDLLTCYRSLASWLIRSAPAGRRLWLVDGNHDLSKNSTNFSSFQFLANLLVGQSQFPNQVTHVAGAGQLTPYGYVIPHVPNQELFDIELAKVPECQYLFVHCNYDNGFAAESDHSLNLSREQAEKLPVRHIVFAHEHQGKVALGDKVIITGNQLPSSVSDCLGNATKSMLVIDDATGDCQLVETWHAAGDFAEIDWRALADTGARFIRATGEATADEAPAVANAISRFRAASSALVITNAVKTAGVDDAEQLQLTQEAVTSFDVREALRELLTDEENNKIDKLRATHA